MRGFVQWVWSIFRYVACFSVVALSVGLYYALLASPADYRQGEVVRIMYLHVPTAWISLGTYALIAFCSLVFLIKKEKTIAVFARSAAPVGACYTLVCLIAGSIWGRYTWGTWWVWDARLTSMLLLLFMYLGYSSLWNVFENPNRAARTSSLFAVFSAINVPIVKFSVNIWSTLHQTSSVLRKGGMAIDVSMLVPLFIMFVALASLFILLVVLRVQTLANYGKAKEILAQFCQGGE